MALSILYWNLSGMWREVFIVCEPKLHVKFDVTGKRDEVLWSFREIIEISSGVHLVYK